MLREVEKAGSCSNPEGHRVPLKSGVVLRGDKAAGSSFMQTLTRFHQFLRRYSTFGLALGMLFYAVSLTPSLLPRTFVMQGILSGVSFALGYGMGLFLRWVWHYMQLPEPRGRALRWAQSVIEVVGVLGVVACLFQVRGWQNSIRELMGLSPLETDHILKIVIISLVVGIVLFLVSQTLRFLLLRFSAWLKRYIPPRIANVLGVTLGLMVLWSAMNRFIVSQALKLTDSSLAKIDAFIEPDAQAPKALEKSGSERSLIPWEMLGKQGRSYVSTGPSAAEISAHTGRPAKEPIRIYAGLGSAGSHEARAALALEDLKRAGGFERSVLVIATPTGTGWMDEQAVDTVEYLHHGDIATVAVQYSYLPSWLSLWVQPEYGAETAHALFEAVYGHWTQLQKDQRPRLYVQGLSLGALNSQKASDLYDVLADPFHGALWSGPPFASVPWKTLTAHRVKGSPEWLPEFRDSSLVRFANQYQTASRFEKPWGPLRVVYFQYASDPIVCISPSMLYKQPDWMKSPRGPDVTPKLRWFPVVTFLQVAVDVLLATEAPMGYGHLYAPEHYVEAWVEVSQPQGWDEGKLEALKAHLRK